jgi:hypothetical protein
VGVTGRVLFLRVLFLRECVKVFSHHSNVKGTSVCVVRCLEPPPTRTQGSYCCFGSCPLFPRESSTFCQIIASSESDYWESAYVECM